MLTTSYIAQQKLRFSIAGLHHLHETFLEYLSQNIPTGYGYPIAILAYEFL